MLTPEDKHCCFFLLANSCTLDSSKQLCFRYLHLLQGLEPSCVAFLVADCTDANRLLVVKFVKHYGGAVHWLLMAHGSVLQLLYCGSVWPADVASRGGVPWKMVVMEHIKGYLTAEANFLDDGNICKAIHGTVHKALQVLHNGRFVHSDIHAPNIMIEGDSVKDIGKHIRIIDFDWAGVEGEVRYLLHLSKIGWPQGVKDHTLITKEHNRAMVNKLC